MQKPVARIVAAGGAGLVLLLATGMGYGSSAAPAPLVLLGGACGAILMGTAIGLALAEAFGARESETEASLAIAKLEREVIRHREALDEFANSLDVMIFVTDGKAVVRYANDQARRAFSWSGEAGQPLLAVTFSHELERLVKEVELSGQPRQAELAFHHPIERHGLVKAWSEPPAMERIFVSIFDVTALKRLERVRRDFVANVSHELRTPMASIRAMAETLQDDPDFDEKTRARYQSLIIKEIDRLAQITEDLLTLSAVEGQPIERLRIPLGEALKAAADLVKPAADAKGLALEWSCEEGLEALASPGLLSQVLVNLLENAVAYTNTGSILASASARGDVAVVEVQDTGIGIGSEHLPRVFERFYRVDKGRSRAKGGTGLGLSIVKHIVEAHGGKVSVQSVLNQGSTFIVELPRPAWPEPPEAAVQPEAAEEALLQGSSNGHPNG